MIEGECYISEHLINYPNTSDECKLFDYLSRIKCCRGDKTISIMANSKFNQKHNQPPPYLPVAIKAITAPSSLSLHPNAQFLSAQVNITHSIIICIFIDPRRAVAGLLLFCFVAVAATHFGAVGAQYKLFGHDDRLNPMLQNNVDRQQH